MVDDLIELATAWQPQVIVRDSSEFGGLILGALLDVPVAVVGIGLRPHLDWLVQAFEGSLATVRRRYGLPADDPVERMTGELWLSSFPPTFAYGAGEIPHERYIRPVVPEAAEREQVPDWLEDIGNQAVYVTLGTVFNRTQDLLRLVVGALAEAGLEVVATTGVNVDPDSLDPLPPNVRVARYVTQSRLSPRVRAVVSHGGFNTVMSALSDGLPVCCVPLAADHPFNASRCVDLGVGTAVTTLTPAWGPPIANVKDVTAARVVEAVMPLLDDASYRSRAVAVAATLSALPGPEQASAWIAELAT
jgi:MGT family glycosyltransferase